MFLSFIHFVLTIIGWSTCMVTADGLSPLLVVTIYASVLPHYTSTQKHTKCIVVKLNFACSPSCAPVSIFFSQTWAHVMVVITGGSQRTIFSHAGGTWYLLFLRNVRSYLALLQTLTHHLSIWKQHHPVFLLYWGYNSTANVLRGRLTCAQWHWLLGSLGFDNLGWANR